MTFEDLRNVLTATALLLILTVLVAAYLYHKLDVLQHDHDFTLARNGQLLEIAEDIHAQNGKLLEALHQSQDLTNQALEFVFGGTTDDTDALRTLGRKLAEASKGDQTGPVTVQEPNTEPTGV